MVNKTCHQLGVQPSVIRELFAYGLAQAKIVGKENVFDYSLGNPSIPAPKIVNDTFKNVIDNEDSISVHGYSMASGFDDTRAAIAANLAKRFNMDISGKDLFLTCGAGPALITVFRALAAEESSEILAIAPFFPEYRPFAEANGLKLVIVPADTKAFQINIDEVEKCITRKTQAVIINSPNNPSGVVYTKETLQKLAVMLERKSSEIGHPIYIIADEPYRELVYGDVTVPWIPAIYKNTIVVYSYSKSLSLPGERIGYIYVPSFADDSSDVLAAVAGAARVIGHVCPPTLMQRMLVSCADEMPDLEAYDANRTLLYNALTEIGYECAKPDGAFYLFVKALEEDDMAFSTKAKLNHNLLLVPGTGFSCPGYIRLAYCVSHDMIERSIPAFKALYDSYNH